MVLQLLDAHWSESNTIISQWVTGKENRLKTEQMVDLLTAELWNRMHTLKQQKLLYSLWEYYEVWTLKFVMRKVSTGRIDQLAHSHLTTSTISDTSMFIIFLKIECVPSNWMHANKEVGVFWELAEWSGCHYSNHKKEAYISLVECGQHIHLLYHCACFFQRITPWGIHAITILQ